MLSDEKLHNVIVATLEEKIQFNQRLIQVEENERRRKFIEELIDILNAKIAKEKV